MMFDEQQPGFTFAQLDNGIHEFHWNSTERVAVDDWMQYNDDLYARTSIDQTLYFLHIINSTRFPPLSYVIRKARYLQMKYPKQPSTRSAILFHSRFFSSMFNTMSNMLNRKGKDVTRFFLMNERDEAIGWLLEE